MAKLAVRLRIEYWHPWHMELTHSPHALGRHIDWLVPPNGDDEWIDSLVRFTHMIDLAAAYRLTAETEYLTAFESYLGSFSESRKVRGRHWKFRLNAAIRVANLIKAFDLIGRTPAPPSSLRSLVYENLLADIRFLLPSVADTVGNGAFFITTALLIAAEYLEGVVAVDEWKEACESRLNEVIRSEVQPDGILAEQVPMYHGQVIMTLLDYCVALNANGRPISDLLRSTIDRMLGALCAIGDPEGMIPPIGDSDRFPIGYLTDLFGAVMGTPYPYDPTRIVADARPTHDEAFGQLSVLPTAGWVVARWNYDQSSKGYLLFDCSGKPSSRRSWHSHADDLQFLLHTTDGPVLTDPGRFTYCSEFKAFLPFTRRRIHPRGKWRHLYSLILPGFMELSGRDWRRYFRRTLAHNTISRDGHDQPQYENQLESGCKVSLLRHAACGRLLLLQGDLDTREGADEQVPATATADSGFRHRRSLVGYLPHLWIVVDQLIGNDAHDWTSSYHLGVGGSAEVKGDRIEVQVAHRRHELRFVAPAPSQPMVTIDDDWVSPLYNRKLPAKTVRATIQRASQAILVTLLCSYADRSASVRKARCVQANAMEDFSLHDVYEVELADGDCATTILVNPESKASRYQGIEFDATVAVVSRRGGRLSEAGLAGGTFLVADGFRLESEDGRDGAFRVFGAQPAPQ